jgi:DedD protein
MSDDQFHEFHLDGKQMVFLFMASTVVAVVIFLCGVMVGRGVRASRVVEPVEASAAVDGGDPTAAATRSTELPPPDPGAASDTSETLPYPQRLDDPTISQEPLRDVAPTIATESPAVAIPEKPAAASRKPALAAAPAAPAVNQAPLRGGIVVQVISVLQRSDADAVMNKLTAKGYPSFVSATTEEKPHFRVRVGPYASRKEAEAAARRLERVEKYRKPWVIPN